MFRALNSWIANNPPGIYGGVTLTDLDGDGQFELLIARSDGANRVLKYSAGQLRDAAPPLLAAADSATLAIAAADVDGDGSEELYLLDAAGNERLLDRTPDGQWFDRLEHPENAGLRGGISIGFGALDRRAGWFGFLLTPASLPPRFLVLGEDGAMADLARSLGISDRRPLLHDSAGLDDTSAVTAVAIDANADGRFDFFLGDDREPHRLLLRQPDGTWRDRATPALAFPSTLTTAVAADFDNDGSEELFLANRGERNRLYRMADAVEMLDAGDAAEPDSSAVGAAVADLDGDGVLELIVSHDGGPVTVYKPRTASGNGWLRVRPLTRFGAPSRGAIVKASVNGRTLIRAIDGGSGGRCLMEPVAHFGLGRETGVDWVSVTWPDGAELRLPNPDVNCTYSVPYPRG